MNRRDSTSLDRPTRIRTVAANGAARPAATAERTGVGVVVLAPEATEHEVRLLVEGIRARGYAPSLYDVGAGAVQVPDVTAEALGALVGAHRAVERTFMPDTRYRLARREVRPTGTVVEVGGVPFGGRAFVVVAGPCAVESRAQLFEAAHAAAAAGASVLRGGAFKPRTSPYNFQGLGLRGVELMAEARAATGLPFFTEIMDPAQVEPMYPLVDGFQVGARNMQNYELLRALGEVDKPVLLKRGQGATVEEWLLAAEYLLVGGNDRVVLCERGIRTFNAHTRFTLDLASVAWAKRETHLPVIVDPSHATGDRALVAPMARAALAAGADGVIVEVHAHPDEALSDGPQALAPAEIRALVADLSVMAPAVSRTVATSPALAPNR